MEHYTKESKVLRTVVVIIVGDGHPEQRLDVIDYHAEPTESLARPLVVDVVHKRVPDLLEGRAFIRLHLFDVQACRTNGEQEVKLGQRQHLRRLLRFVHVEHTDGLPNEQDAQAA